VPTFRNRFGALTTQGIHTRAKAKLGLVPTLRNRFGALTTQGIQARAQAKLGLVPTLRNRFGALTTQGIQARASGQGPRARRSQRFGVLHRELAHQTYCDGRGEPGPSLVCARESKAQPRAHASQQVWGANRCMKSPIRRLLSWRACPRRPTTPSGRVLFM
jgi:hypothetical protein